MERSELAQRLADHEMGLELQLIELEVRQDRARTQQLDGEVQRLQHEIAVLQEEMALAVEQAAVLAEDGVSDAAPWSSAA